MLLRQTKSHPLDVASNCDSPENVDHYHDKRNFHGTDAFLASSDYSRQISVSTILAIEASHDMERHPCHGIPLVKLSQ